jgi:ribonuclease HIII
MGHIGVDESGKGDYFGYLVVAAVYCKDEKKLKELGIRDSKKIPDQSIRKLALQIKKICEFNIVKISPEKYNHLYKKFGSLNKLLAWGHARAIENLLSKVKCDNVIIDKFTDESVVKDSLMELGKKAKLVQNIKGESDVVVAAASILARDEFLATLRNLGRDIGLVLPKGATHVEETAKEIAKKYGADMLENVAKIHFKTTRRVLGN